MNDMRSIMLLNLMREMMYKKIVFLISIILLLGLIISQSYQELIDQKKDFSVSENSEIDINGKKYVVIEGAEVRFNEKGFQFSVSREGTIIIDGNDFFIVGSEDKPAQFIFDTEGKLTTGTTFTTKEGAFTLRGYSLPLPENSEVEYLKYTISINVPPNTEINPSISDPKKTEGILEIKTKEKGFLKITGGNFQVIDAENNPKETNLYFANDNGKLRVYFTDKTAAFMNDKGEIDFTIVNPNHGTQNPEIDLVFDDRISYSKPYVLATKTRIGSFARKGNGPIISIGPGNRIDLGGNLEGGNDLSQDRTVFFQGRNGFVILNRGETDKIPTLQMKGDSLYNPDRESFYIGKVKSGSKLYHKPGSLIEGVNHGEGTVALRVLAYDDKGKKTPHELYVNNENEYRIFSEDTAKKLMDPFSYIIEEVTNRAEKIFSPGVAINQLSQERKQQLIQLGNEDRKDLIKNYLKPGGIAALEKRLDELYHDVLGNSAVSASVQVLTKEKNSLGSGTIVGYNEGKVYVLTAAHVVNEEEDQENIEIYLQSLQDPGKSTKLDKEPGIPGKIVAYSERLGVKGLIAENLDKRDLALLELTPDSFQMEELKRRGYVQIAPPEFGVNEGDRAVFVGCPQGNFYVRGCRITEIMDIIGTDTLEINSEPYKGQSGGGLFMDGKLIGVVQSGRPASTKYPNEIGGFANLESIHKFLDENGYSFLYKFIIFILFRKS